MKCYTQVYVLSVNDEPILAVAESPKSYDVSAIHRMKWRTMTFNAFELGSIDAVQNAYDILKDGGDTSLAR